jgi:hydroxylamine dehydrogenase
LCLGLLFAAGAFADDCLECHKDATPAAVAQWQASVHAPDIGCAACHGTDHEAILKGQSPADAKVCGRCHEKAYAEHVSSKHGLGLHSGWGCTRNLNSRDPRECRFCHEEGSTRPKTTVQCARFLTQSSEMGALGCNRCHQVENSCASCHTNHMTDLAAVRAPQSCATCHMGPDHPQWEMWQTSRHGVLFESLGETAGPTCQRCHMPQGSHDVSYGITMSPAMLQLPAEQSAVRRQEMLALCAQCHGKSFAERELQSADAILEQSQALIRQAEAVIRDLADRNLLVPSLQERPEHPLRGRELVLDGQMLYEDISHVERLFFKMKKYDLAKTVKGAFHQNPAYTHWYGNAELKMTLADIKAEAARLQSGGGVRVEETPRQAGEASSLRALQEQLQVLKRKYDRGAIGTEQYNQSKQQLLEQLPGD